MSYASQQSVAAREAAAAAAAKKKKPTYAPPAAKQQPPKPKPKPAPRKTYAPPAAQQEPPGRKKPQTYAKPKPKPAPKPKAAPRPKAAPKPKSTSTKKTTTTTATAPRTTSLSTSTAAVAAPKPPSEKEWRASDSAFIAEQSSIQAELATIMNQIANQRAKVGTEYGETFRNLGLRQVEGSKDWGDAVWDRDNLLGAYGQSVNNQVNDFAARGLLDSGLYTQELGTLTRGFDQQRSDLARGQGSAIEDLAMQETAAQSQMNTALERARAESAMRRAAAYGLTGV